MSSNIIAPTDDMPEMIDDKKVFSLLELGQSIKRMFDQHYSRPYWVKAEMNKLNHYGRSGHCFPDLVEKKGDKVIAEMRAMLWKGDYQRIDKEFKELVGEPLKEGIKILLKCTVSYDPKYGLSLRILDIDVNFTLGDLAREKKETLARLSQEGLLDANKKLATPVLPKRIAVISVETSNGYADFIKVLETNAHGYTFVCKLFPSLLQGDRAVATMLAQLKEIERSKEDFDMVAIIRGGGGDIGLSFLNKYELAQAVAIFPLPIVTGIGHATNQTVVETIAHKDAITPTEMADWLIQRFYSLDIALDKAMLSLKTIPQEILFGATEALNSSSKILRSEAMRSVEQAGFGIRTVEQALVQQSNWKLLRSNEYLQQIGKKLGATVKHGLAEKRRQVQEQGTSLTQGSKRKLNRCAEHIDVLSNSIKNMSPEQVLKRGYSITRLKGKALLETAALEEGAVLETTFYEGKALSKVTETK